MIIHRIRTEAEYRATLKEISALVNRPGAVQTWCSRGGRGAGQFPLGEQPKRKGPEMTLGPW
jgi:hypothetical protein